MAVKTKDINFNISDFSENFETKSAKNKTAVYIEGITQNDVENLDMSIVDNCLVIKNTDNKFVKLSNYTGIKYIKTDKSGKTYKLTDIIANNYVNNTANEIKTLAKPYYNAKKLTVTGTNYNDVIDYSQSGYEPKGKTNIKKNKGLTINGGNGNDEITGTDYNDTIKGGNGNDTVTGGIGADNITGGAGITTINYTKGHGNDVINLTKGEQFTLNIDGVTDITDLKFEYANKNKDLRIYTDKNSTAEYLTIKNFATKDVTNNSNAKKSIVDSSYVELVVGGKTYNLRTSKNITDDEDVVLYKTTLGENAKNFTGTWLNDEIDASGVKLYKKVKKQTVEKDLIDTGLTIKGGAGNDTITGTKYSDKIYGNAGTDTINAGTGNNYIYFNKGDGNDIVENGNGIDTLVFAKRTNLEFSYDNTDLIIKYSDNDTVTVKDYFIDKTSVKYIKIGNNISELKYLVKMEEHIMEYDENDIHIIKGTSKSETLTGSDNDDEIYGRGGNDIIYGGEGNDKIYINNSSSSNYNVIYGGKGNDYIESHGNTDFHFSKGDGNDIINSDFYNVENNLFFDDETDINNINVSYDNNIFVAKYNNDVDSITFMNNFYPKIIVNDLEYRFQTNLSGKLVMDLYFNNIEHYTYDKNATYYTKNNDVVNITDIKNSIFTGPGDDTITVEKTGYVGKISAGIGDDNITISGEAEAVYGEAYLGYLSGYTGNDIIKIENTATVGTVDSGLGNNEITIYGTVDNLYDGDGNDTIDIYGTVGKFYHESGDDTINIYEDASVGTFTTVGNGHKDINVYGSVDHLEGGHGSSKMNISGTVRYIECQEGDDEIILSGTVTQGISLHGYDDINKCDNNIVTTTSTSQYGYILFKNDVGNDTLYLNSTKDTLKFAGDTDLTYSWSDDGKDIIINYWKGRHTVTIKDFDTDNNTIFVSGLGDEDVLLKTLVPSKTLSAPLSSPAPVLNLNLNSLENDIIAFSTNSSDISLNYSDLTYTNDVSTLIAEYAPQQTQLI